MTMHSTHIDQIDLNLLPALIALLDERHVSRAARVAGVGQSAMSRALQRLRRALDDELLVRGPTGYELTPRAQRIRVQLRDIVPQLERIFAAETFDPASAERSFRLVGSDYAVLTFGSTLFRRVLDESPQSSLCFESWHSETFAQVDEGSIDLVFYGAPGPNHLKHEHLFTDHFVCVVSSDHPLAKQRTVHLRDYLKWPHLVISIDNDRQPAIDNRLDELGVRRRPGLIVPFHAATPAVRGTHLIATIPARLIGSQSHDGLSVLRAPHEVDELPYSMTWSPLVDREPGHQWLRQVVRSSVMNDNKPSQISRTTDVKL
jgi:DNA-binding transcriptional LysR family regulator